MGDDERKWLENFKAVNGFDSTTRRLTSIQQPLPIPSNRPRKPHRLQGLVDLTRADVLLGRFRRGPRSVTR